MDPKTFRKNAHELVDWMADYFETVGDGPIVPHQPPGAVKSQLPDLPPETGEPFDALFRDFRELIVPNMTHWNHPGWFAYFPANNSPPSVLAEMLMATMGAQCMSWQTSPAATELEEVVMAWLREMCGLPETFTGVIQDTASTATLVALLSARERATGGTFGSQGSTAARARMRVYASSQAHSSVDKAVKLAGFGLENLVRVPTQDDFSVDAEALRAAVEADVAAGLLPVAVCATLGTTSSTAVDNLRTLGPICDAHDLWLHVDAAYAGTAAICPEMRWMLDGIERADSYVFNPHKWMLTNFDCTAYFVRDVDALLRTFALTPEYLKTAHDDDVKNFRDWGVQLGRRFRALKLWFVIRSYGLDGLRDMIRGHVAMARDFREAIEAHPEFDVMAPSPFGLVCFRWNPKDGRDLDAANQALLEGVNASDRVYMTHTRLGGDYVLRLCIGQWQTTAERVDEAWEIIQRVADAL